MTKAIGSDAARLSISVELPRALSGLVEPGSGAAAAVRNAIEDGLRSVLARFGIPGGADVSIAATGANVADGGRLLRVAVDGQLAHYPDELLQHVWCYVAGRLLDPDARPHQIEGWLKDRPARQAADIAGEFLRLACTQILERQPAILFGLPQARAYAALLAAGGSRPDPTRLLEVLSPVLALRISIADLKTVDAVLAEHRDDASTIATIESLIDTLRRSTVDLRMDRATLQRFTSLWASDGPGMFTFLRDGLFEELGMPFPALRFVVAPDQRPDTFAVQINDSVSVPLVVLQPNQVMVNDTADRLKLMDLAGGPTSNPATGHPNAVIDAASEARAEAAHLTTWNQMGHLVLCLAECLRQNLWTTIDRAGTRRQLQQLEGAFPALVESVRRGRTDEELTALLRELVRERVSVQNLRAILESVVDQDLATERSAGNVDRVARTRIALGPAIAYKAARGTGTLVVYLVDAQIARLTAGSATALAPHADSIVAALRSELAHLPETAQVPCLLTSIESRAALQRVIATEYPRMTVLAHEELPPGFNVQPVARVAL